MALESEATVKNENEEDDFGCYFLQPTASPYNIIEKIQQANFDLFNSTPQSTRSTKVKFKDELISFEADLTDDDVNSIESDHVIEEIISNHDNKFGNSNEEHETKLQSQDVLRGGVGIYDIEEEVEDNVYEEVISDENDDDIQPIQTEEFIVEIKEAVEHSPKNDHGVEDQPEDVKATSETIRETSRQKSPKRKKYPLRRTEVHCKDHCIEKIDTHLSMSIRKLEIHEKPPVRISLPPLQLHQRKCCDENKLPSNNRVNLPNYKGYRSEYGLSSRQIKNRNRHIEMIRQKEMARQQLIDEYRALKIQQNEEVFCQWLKEVSRRQHKEKEITKNLYKNGYKTPSPGNLVGLQQKCLSPSVVNINKTVNKPEKITERPKTAGFVPKTNIKKKRRPRPHTTQSCVYIELPPEILKKGVHIGDLLITNSKEISKKLHILTVS